METIITVFMINDEMLLLKVVQNKIVGTTKIILKIQLWEKCEKTISLRQAFAALRSF